VFNFLHILPARFVRIRHYGYLANRGRVQRIAALKARLGEPELPPLKEANPENKESYDPLRCPHCGQLALKLIAIQRGRARNKAPPPANP
jgi:hypothetical protein